MISGFTFLLYPGVTPSTDTWCDITLEQWKCSSSPSSPCIRPYVNWQIYVGVRMGMHAFSELNFSQRLAFMAS